MTSQELIDGMFSLISRAKGGIDEKVELGREPTIEDVPKILAECLLARMKLGRINYGDFNQWKQRMSRPGYRRKRIKNTSDHLYNIATDNFDEDDLYGNIGGVLFGCMVLLEFMESNKETERRNCIPAFAEPGRVYHVAVVNSKFCSCIGVALPSHIEICPVCKLRVKHRAEDPF